MKPVPIPLIVHVVYRFSVGGLENGVVNLINRLSPSSWRHVVLSLTEVDASFANRVARQDIDYIALHKRSGHAIGLYPKLFALFRKLRPAIVHTRNLAALEASVPAWAARVPARLHGEHGRDMGDLDGSNVRYQRVRRLYRPFVTRYVALSPDLERYLSDRVGVRPERITQIYNGVDTQRFRPAENGRAPIDGCPFQDPGLWLVGTVGRMEPVKDQSNLARAFVEALRLEPKARQRMRLVLVGDGTLRSEVQHILEQGGARDRAWLAGERADVPAVLRGLDCFVLPSRAEGVSNTVLEAMASGLPVVATRAGANAELMENGSTGYLVPPLDPASLAERMLELLRQPDLAAAMGRRGRARVVAHFQVSKMVARYESLYHDTLRSRGAIASSRFAEPRSTSVTS